MSGNRMASGEASGDASGEASRVAPIGIFDSGVGGMTVLRALLARLPHEDYRFLGDTARLPYGTKGRDTIVEYTLRAAHKLVATGPVKMLVVACNTASSVALPALEENFPHIPVVGVIEPGARAAVAASRRGHIAVLATEATVRGGAYVRAIRRLKPDARVVGQPCTLFVALAEEGWLEGEVAEGIARRYLANVFPGLDARDAGASAQADMNAPDQNAPHTAAPDTVLLGCTHFPLLQTAIRRVLGDGVEIVDSARTTAEAVAGILQERNLLNPATGGGAVRFMATDNVARFAATGHLFLGRAFPEDSVELVDI